ncbi:MAG: hypothetical protein WEA61_01825 [Anaerolineales bacterium]
MRLLILVSRLVLISAFFLSACAAPEFSYVAVPSPSNSPEASLTATVPVASEPPAPEGTETTLPLLSDFERNTDQVYNLADQPDDVEGYQVHFIYALPRGSRDDFLDINGVIALSAAAMNRWLEGQSGHRLRFDTYQGALDISFLPLAVDEGTISDLGTRMLPYIEYEIKARGFNPSFKLFVVYYDGFFVAPGGYCGLGSYPPEGAGQTAVLLLRGYNPTHDYVCPRQFTKSEDYTGYFEMTILHEVLHLLGMAPACAPNNDEGHVTDSSQDLMYYQYDGSYSPLYTYLDYNNNDYYNHGNPDCPDLARSIFLDPLPEKAELPPGWDVSSRYFPPNPLEGE